MSFRCVLSEEALQSIEEQAIWLEENAGDEVADHWQDCLRKCLRQIAEYPLRNGFAPENERSLFGVEIRQRRLRPWKGKPGWRVLFLADVTLGKVIILQVRHERRPWVEE